MAIFVGNFCLKFSIDRGSRVLNLLMKKASSISCCRAYQPSGPVRYIPKKYREIEEKQTIPSLKNSEESDNFSDSSSSRDKVSWGGSDAGRMSNFGEKYQNQSSCADTVFYAESVKSSNMFRNTAEFSELEYDSSNELEVPDHDFMVGLDGVDDEFEISHEKKPYEEDAIKSNKTKRDAEKVAIEALAKRAFTAVELRKKLQGKRFPLNIIEGVIADFQSRGLINDYLYAETFSRSRWSSSCWGPRRIKQALLQKGVNEADVEKAMKFVFEHSDSGNNQQSSLGMSEISMEHLFDQALKQWLRGRDMSHEKRKSRIIRWLQYRGFNWSVTNIILKKLESQHPP